jgi:hypothetical protein
VATARLNLEKFETRSEHDPRDPMVARLEDTFGAGNPAGYDELKEKEVLAAVERMLEKKRQNGKPIFVVDDGGIVARVLRKYYPPETEAEFTIVEWTTRGAMLFDELESPKASMTSAAEAKAKTEIEPAFIADAAVEHAVVAGKSRFGTLEGLPVLGIGYGNIGRAAQRALAREGALVTVTDTNPKRLEYAEKFDRLGAEPDVIQALKGKKLIIPATGRNSAPPEVFGASDPGSTWFSLSSVDIETRDPRQWANGTWGTDLVRMSVNATVDPSAEGGVRLEYERREVLGGGYPINLDRRARVMPIQREEVILMVLNEAIAQAVLQRGKAGKHQLPPERNDRIFRIYGEVHPEEMALARAFNEDALRFERATQG